MAVLRVCCMQLILFTGMVVAGDAEEAPASRPVPDDIQELAGSYTNLIRATQVPAMINASLARLCRGMTTEELVLFQKLESVKETVPVHMYVNRGAITGLTTKTTAFPVGSVIVKDKVVGSGRPKDHPHTELDGVGGMIKRSPGFDPEHGDWEYFYFTDPKQVEAGKIASCVTCHSKASATDYVYGNWFQSKPSK